MTDDTEKSSSLPPGTRLGRYEIRSQLGAGGMGIVYLGVDTELGRTVALKILPQGLTPNPKLLSRFIQEAKAASERIKAGTSFPAIAAERGLKEQDIDLGKVTKAGIVDRAVADAAFDAFLNVVYDGAIGRARPKASPPAASPRNP